MSDKETGGRSPWATMLRDARKAKRWTQDDLADAAGVHRSTIIRQEKGEVTPDRETLRKLVHVLGNITLADAEALVHDEPADVPLPPPLPAPLAEMVALYNELDEQGRGELLDWITKINRWAELLLAQQGTPPTRRRAG